MREKTAVYQKIEVEEVISHEKYDEWTYDQDIMLMKLKSPIEFSDEVSPICLPMAGEEFEPGLKCYTTGWGDLEGNGNFNYCQALNTEWLINPMFDHLTPTL